MKRFFKLIIFNIIFKKISKTNDGRCVECDANNICSKYNVCTCNDDQQYKLKDFRYLLK